MDNSADRLVDIRVGDWVTQYQKGYWRVERIVPVLQHATEPPQLAQILVLKKACDEKFVPKSGMATCNLHWCKKVSAEIQDKIRALFEQNPKALEAFNEYSKTLITIHNISLLLEETEIKEVQVFIDNAPAVMHYADLQIFKGKIKKYDYQSRLCNHNNANQLISCLIQLTNYNIETDENDEEIWCGTKLIVNRQQ